MNFRITGERLEGFAEQARRLGNVTGKLTPGQIEDTLKGVDLSAGTGNLDFPEKVVYFNNMNGFEYAKKKVVFSESELSGSVITKVDTLATDAAWGDSMVAVMRDDAVGREITFQETYDVNSPKFIDNGFSAVDHRGVTIGAWFCKKNTTNTYERLIHIYTGNANFGLYIASNQNYQIWRDIPGTGYASTAEIKLNQWFHMAYSLERISDTQLVAKSYLNGTLIATDNITDLGYYFHRMRVGDSKMYPWPGYVKNVFLSDGVLTDEEVRLMMLYEQVSEESTRLPTADMSLTFNIKPYASLEQLSLDAPENGTIGMVTENAVANYIFSASEPQIPEEGTVWIQTGLDSNAAFHISDGNMLQVCPVLAKQYIGGAWKVVPAKSYRNGEWITWRVPLYTFGDEHKACTGGWIAEAKSYPDGAASVGVVTRNADHIKLSRTNSSNGFIFRCANAIDLTGHSVLRFEGILNDTNGYHNWMQLVVWSEIGQYSTDNIVVNTQQLVDGAVELDVSALNGPYYIGFLQYNKSASATIRKLYVQ